MDPTHGVATVPVYRVKQAPDGTYTIYDVPIFSAHAEELRGGEVREFSAEWLQNAVAAGLQRQAEGYLPPLHVRHHGDGEVEAAGKFQVTRVGTIKHGGEETPTIFADLVGVRPAIYERIRRGELSYRSVEILDVGKTEIDSLALLDDEVPFFRFPLLRVAESNQTVTRVSGGPVLAYSQSGRSGSALFRYAYTKEPNMDPKTGTAPATNPTKKAANAEQVLAQIFQLLKQVMGDGGQQAGPAEQPAPQQQPQAAQAMQPMQPQQQQRPTFSFSASEGATVTIDDVATANATNEGTKDAMLARMESMEKELKKLREERKVEAKAHELVSAGFSSEQVSAFRARASEAGLAVAVAYAAGMEHIGPSEPPRHWTGEIRHEAPDAPEVAAFGAKGPEALAEARELHGSWRRSGSSLSFADFHAANSNPDAYLGVRG